MEINLRRKKWLLVCKYNPLKTLVKDCLECISKEIDSFSTNYDNVLLLGDFNSEPTEETFYQLHNLKRLLHEPTYYKNLNKSSCIDLVITNRPKSFQNSCTFLQQRILPSTISFKTK